MFYELLTLIGIGLFILSELIEIRQLLEREKPDQTAKVVESR